MLITLIRRQSGCSGRHIKEVNLDRLKLLRQEEVNTSAPAASGCWDCEEVEEAQVTLAVSLAEPVAPTMATAASTVKTFTTLANRTVQLDFQWAP